ncbi:hypothetical protein GCM10028808_53810 [Spirosoma migulaei]
MGTSRYSYPTSLRQLRSDLNTDVKAITGQKNDLIVLSYQPASHNVWSVYPGIALELLNLALTEKNFYLGPVMYPYTYVDDIHLDATSYTKVGALAGYIMKRILIDGVDFKPIYLKSWSYQGKVLEAVFNVPVKPLILDTVLVSDPGGYGFSMLSGSIAGPNVVSGSVVRPDTVRLIFDAPITPGMVFRYSINGTTGKSGPTQGSRGCLRDSQGNTVIYDQTGINYAMHNWCPIFEQVL